MSLLKQKSQRCCDYEIRLESSYHAYLRAMCEIMSWLRNTLRIALRYVLSELWENSSYDSTHLELGTEDYLASNGKNNTVVTKLA